MLYKLVYAKKVRRINSKLDAAISKNKAAHKNLHNTLNTNLYAQKNWPQCAPNPNRLVELFKSFTLGFLKPY